MLSVSEVLFLRRVHLEAVRVKYLRLIERNQYSSLSFLLPLRYGARSQVTLPLKLPWVSCSTSKSCSPTLR